MLPISIILLYGILIGEIDSMIKCFTNEPGIEWEKKGLISISF